MASFPSSEEQAVASSLLLLQTKSSSPSLSTPKFHFNFNDEVPERSSSNNSSSSSLIIDDGDSSHKDKIKSRTSSFISATARYRQMKFKIARKIRSKVTWTSSSSSSGDRNQNADASIKVIPVSISGEATSCLSNSSSGISSERRIRYANRVSRCAATTTRETRMGRELPAPAKPHRAKNIVGSPHLRRRGDAILKLLSLGGSSEIRIRQMLGDSPDTSKALRMLLRVDAVKRTGSGGRHDPYVYTITQITGRKLASGGGGSKVDDGGLRG